jgi:pimeloyl-ACP methyl ester carboxylesterase
MSGLPASIARLQAQARRLTTPLDADRPGDGHMVWHVWGDACGGALPLVMLHGGSGSWTHWLRSMDALLAQGRQLWLPDLPGFGDSDTVPGGNDVDTLVAPLLQGLRGVLPRAADGAGPLCDLVGFSFGGMAAGLLAAADPGLARRLVLVGAPGMGVGKGLAVRLKGWRHLETPQAQEAAHRYNLQALMLHDAGGIDADTLQLHVLNVERDRLPRRRLSHTDVLARALQQVACPVAAIYGAHDALYPGPMMQELVQVFARQLRDFRGLALVPGAGHWVMHEQPQAFVAALSAALDG